jgi:uncharacterized protein
MPVRSLSSSVFKWPGRREVDKAFHVWASQLMKQDCGVIKVGYFGSYARGDWGVGSDLDLVAVVEHSDELFERRSLKWELNEFPVPAQIIVYTLKEWDSLTQQANRFVLTLEREAVWVHEGESAAVEPT